jgi:hypothetical protein
VQASPLDVGVDLPLQRTSAGNDEIGVWQDRAQAGEELREEMGPLASIERASKEHKRPSDREVEFQACSGDAALRSDSERGDVHRRTNQVELVLFGDPSVHVPISQLRPVHDERIGPTGCQVLEALVQGSHESGKAGPEIGHVHGVHDQSSAGSAGGGSSQDARLRLDGVDHIRPKPSCDPHQFDEGQRVAKRIGSADEVLGDDHRDVVEQVSNRRWVMLATHDEYMIEFWGR